MVMPINQMTVIGSLPFYHHVEQLVHHEENSAVVKEFVACLVSDAAGRNASDIHFEPQRHKMLVRFRIDGVLHRVCAPQQAMRAVIVNHLKLRANLDIAEKRLPQDGRCDFVVNGQQVTGRLSTLPTLYGEKSVLRLFYKRVKKLSIAALGMEHWQQQVFLQALARPQGLILITGPTGSGKTTTLYTALARLNNSSRNISCVEDPVEIELEGINQLSINRKIGLTFQLALQSLLRQDPDVIVVGEIRNPETATMVIQAAQTGHLVFSTLHTNSAAESLSRLALMGVADFDLLQSVTLVVAQRLLRKLCPYCKVPSKKFPDTFVARGCVRCLRGYCGQVGVYECLDVAALKNLRQLKTCTRQSLQASAAIKVKQGITSVAEVTRVIGGVDAAISLERC